MKFFALLFLVAVAFSHNFPEEDGVVVLNDSTFDSAIEEFGSLLVEFYAPVCPPPASPFLVVRPLQEARPRVRRCRQAAQRARRPHQDRQGRCHLQPQALPEVQDPGLPHPQVLPR